MQTPSRRETLRAAGAVLGLATAGCLGSDGESAGSGSAPSTQYDAVNSGHHPETTGPSGELEVAWRHRSGIDRGFFATQPVIADGTLFYGVTDVLGWDPSALFAVDTRTGDERWRFDLERGLDRTPAVAGERLIVPGDGRLYGLRTDDGSREWTLPVGSTAETPAVRDDRVYLTTSGGALRAVDATDGTPLWTVPPTGERVRVDPEHSREADRGEFVVVTEDRILHRYTGEEHELVCRDRESGDVRWRRQTPVRAPPVGRGDRLYGLVNYEAVTSFDPRGASPNRVATVYGTGGLYGQPPGVAVADGVAYVAGGLPNAYREVQVNAIGVDGQHRWTVDVPDRFWPSTPIVADGIVYVAAGVRSTDDGATLLGITTGGEVVFDRDVPGRLSAPTVLDGTLYAGVSEAESSAGVAMTAFREA